jgi:hypothetical protein
MITTAGCGIGSSVPRHRPAINLSAPHRKYGPTESGSWWMPGADAECDVH